jgi:hypothetical protein
MKAFISCFVFEINEMINNDVFVIFIANFENFSIKIRFDQFLKSLIIEYINESIKIYHDISKILLEKVDIDAFKNLDIVSSEKKLSKNKKIEKIITKINFINFFILNISEDDENIKSNINNH